MSATRWLEEATGLLAHLHAQADELDAASRICADAIAADGVVHLFGTGHSRIPVEEMFPRYGSYPGFHPIVELSMTFHTQVVGANGQRQAMFIERVEGLADAILANFTLRPSDALLVFSHSGVNAVSLEMAQRAREAGLKVVAVTSRAQNAAAPRTHPTGTCVADHADVVIDLATPVGDAIVEVDGFPAPIGPASSFTAVAIANCIKVRTAELLAERGVRLPVIASDAVVGALAPELFDAAYREHARRARAVLRT
jgi:uncharacterized phosphosugar-binding protein